MKAVILAGGLGMRIRPFTKVIPKPLLPIGEKSVLEIQINQLKRSGFNEIYIATNYMGDYIERFFGDGSSYGVKLTFSREEEPLGSAGPLSLLKDELTEPFIVMNGDILSLIDYEKFFNFAVRNNGMLTLAIKKHITPYAFGNIFFQDDLVTGLEEKSDIIRYIMAGIYVMTPDIFEYIPEKKSYGMDDLIRTMLEKKVPILKYLMSEYWIDIGRIDDYEEANIFYNEHLKEVSNF